MTCPWDYRSVDEAFEFQCISLISFSTQIYHISSGNYPYPLLLPAPRANNGIYTEFCPCLCWYLFDCVSHNLRESQSPRVVKPFQSHLVQLPFKIPMIFIVILVLNKGCSSSSWPMWKSTCCYHALWNQGRASAKCFRIFFLSKNRDH